MGCTKRDIVEFVPRGSFGDFAIDLSELEEANLSHAIREERGVGMYIPYCNFQAHRGIIVNGLVYQCMKKGCRYFRRYVESGVGDKRIFSTKGNLRKVKPYARDTYRQNSSI